MNWKKFNEFIDNEVVKLNIPIERNMSPHSFDVVCASIETIFKNVINEFVPEVDVSDGKTELSSKSLALLKGKKN